MALRLDEVLRLPVVQRFAPEVVAGADQLHRSVRWAHSAEPMDIARFLRRGDLLLTTGIELARHTDALRGFVKELAEAGAAGLVVELGRAFAEVPPDLVTEADQRGLPLVVLHRETRYVEVTEGIHSAIVNRQYELLTKADRIGREFTGLVMAEADLRVVLERTASIVTNPVVLEDAAHQVVELAPHGQAVEDLLADWEHHSRADHAEADTVPTGSAPRCLAAPVWVRGEAWGRLHVLPDRTPIDEVDRLALDRAAAALGTLLLIEAHAAHHAVNARSTFLADVVHGRFESGQELARRARSLGTDLDDRPLVAMLATPRDLAGAAGSRGLSEEGRQGLLDALVEEADQVVADLTVAGLVGREGDRVAAVVAPGPGPEGVALARRLADALVARAGTALEGLDVVAGLSDPVPGPDRLRQAFARADQALTYALAMGTGPGVQRFQDLGLHHLLARLAEGPELARFVEAELGPLLTHDAATSAPLLPTLRAVLVAGGGKTGAAQALGIRRRTLYHRLARLETLVGRPLDDHDTRTRLAVALQGLDLLRSRSPRHG